MNKTLVFITAIVVAPAVARDAPSSVAAVAAPRIIMFYGGVLEGRRYMTSFEENMSFMGAIAELATIQRDAVTGRPFIEVALFWHNPTWESYAADTALLKTLRPEWGQPARFYLGGSQHLPVFDYYTARAAPGLRTVSATGMEILKRHTLPVYADRQER